MRKPKDLSESVRAQNLRKQAYMDQHYLTNLTRNIIGELEIVPDDLQKVDKGELFGAVLHHIMDWNAETLGRIAVYGLARGETSEDIPLRTTTLEETWFGTPPEPELGGRLMLEWIAANVLVASIRDLFFVVALRDALVSAAREGGEEGFRL